MTGGEAAGAKKKGPSFRTGLLWGGDGLLSHGSPAVSSARRGLTSLFGMGRGGPPRCSHHVSLSGSTWSGGGTDNVREACARAARGRRAAVRAGLPGRHARSVRAISSARLNVSPRLHLRPIDVLVLHDPSRKPNLEAGFALRCLQRLSRPNAATRRCGWRHNRCTGGSSAPVLSY